MSGAPLRGRLAADGIYTFALRILSMLVAASLGVLTARVLGAHGRGIYAAPMVDAGIASAGFSGLSSATSYFLLRRDCGSDIVRIVLSATAVFVAIATVVTVALAYLARSPWAAVPAVLSLPGPALLMVVTGYATGTHRIRLTTTFPAASTALLLLVMAATFATISRAPSAAIAVWVATPNLAALAMLIWMIRDARDLPKGRSSARAFLRYSLRAGLVSLVTLLNYRADIYIVAVFCPPAMLGMYTLAVSASEALLAATQVTAVVTAPHIGSLDERAAAELVARAVRHNVFVATLTCAALALVAPFAVRLLYGAAFAGVVPALRVLLAGVLALSLGSPMSTYFTIRQGRPEVALVLAGMSATICIVASLALVPRIGILGAAFASSSAYILGQSAALVYFARCSGIALTSMLVPRTNDIRTYVRALSTMIGS